MVVPSNPSRHPRNVIARRQITLRGPGSSLRFAAAASAWDDVSTGEAASGRAWGRLYARELIRRAAANRGAVGSAPRCRQPGSGD